MTLPRPIPLLVALLGAVSVASAVAGVFLAVSQRPPAWFFLGFETVVVLASVFLVLLGLGRIKEGPAITLLCAAGAIGAGSLLGWQATGKQINGHSVAWLLLLRMGIAGLLTLGAAAEVALRAPARTLPKLGWGLVCGLPVVVAVALARSGKLGALVSGVAGGSPSLAFGVWMVVGIVGVALTSASGHLLITGFQIGVWAFDAPRPVLPPAPPAAALCPGAPGAAPAPAVAAATPANPPAPSGTRTETPG
ncbi:MAG: hypothetical protein K2X97_08570 [Mycobacteriaceae bacterium]|nr:hypothetical protein [Mycobacteriaceae bacterium]